MTPVVATALDLRHAVAAARSRGQVVGLVPTMGALHDGHAGLIRQARAECGYVVVSVFVNPTQFGPAEDFHRYPRPFDADRAAAAEAGADLIFAPTVEAMYPPGFRTHVEVGGLGDVLEGSIRPGHFRGVSTVVLKLFNLAQADRAYFGQKDAQQVRVIQQMVRDLDVPVEVRVLPTARAADGLALSSRNRYLNADQRSAAPALGAALAEVRDRVNSGTTDADQLQRTLAERLTHIAGATLDYAVVVDADTLAPLDHLDRPALAAVAVRFGSTRLIDNVLLHPPAPPGRP